MLEPGAWTPGQPGSKLSPGSGRLCLCGKGLPESGALGAGGEQMGEEGVWDFPLWGSHHRCLPSPSSDPSKDHDPEALFWEPI